MQIDKTEFRGILKGLKGLPKEANAEIRKEAQIIADQVVIPRIQIAMDASMPISMSSRMKLSVRRKSDRLPAVKIGLKKKVFSGGASTIIMRYGTIVGVYTSKSGKEVNWPKGIVRPGWTGRAADMYIEPAYKLWQIRVEEIVKKWNRGSNG